jgi:hypothetical protein
MIARCLIVMSTGDACLHERWMQAMKQGDWERAWQESEAALRSRAQPRGGESNLPLHMRDVWNGTDFVGRRVLVRCHHGLGDSLQFLRYLPVLKQHVPRLSLKIQNELRPLLAGISEIDAILSLDDPDPDFQVDLEIMELPFALRHLAPKIPELPNLVVSPELRQSFRSSFSGPRIGVAWSAGNFIPERSLSPRFLKRLLQIIKDEWPGAIFSLQRGPAVELLDEADRRIFQAGAEAPALIQDTAAWIAEMDLVISVDTMVAHLSGSLRRPTWILLRQDCDWRWMLDREDSPWYSTARLFRQDHEGDWESVLEKVQRAIQERERNKARKGPSKR